jgi:hypothetical protein
MRLRRNPLLQSRRGDDFAPRLQDRGIGAYRFGGTMPNGTSSDQETIEATIAPFYHAIGRTTARWQHVEAGLFVLAHAIMQTDYKYSSVVFLHIQNTDSKVKLVDRLCRAHFDKTIIKNEWTPLLKDLNSAKRGDSRHQIIYRARGRHLCCLSRDLPKERAAIAKTADAAQIGMNSSARWAAIEETTNTQRFEEESWLGDLDSNQD